MFWINTSRSDVTWKQMWMLSAQKLILDVVQIPNNPWLKATLICSSLYDNEKIQLLFVSMRWILSRNMNRGNRRNSTIGVRPTVYLRWSCSWNVTRAKRRNSCRVLGLPPNCALYGLETRLSPTERNRELAVELHLVKIRTLYVFHIATRLLTTKLQKLISTYNQ